MTVYVEASALWAMYYGDPGGDNVESLVKDFDCATSEYTVLELARAVSKRVNAKEISGQEADALESFILKDINQLKNTKKFKLLGVTWRLLREAYSLIIPNNLYASDALHLATATLNGAKLLVVDDFHFTRLKTKFKQPVILPIATPMKEIRESL